MSHGKWLRECAAHQGADGYIAWANTSGQAADAFDKLAEALRNLLARVDDQLGSGDEYDWKEQAEARKLLHSCGLSDQETK